MNKELEAIKLEDMIYTVVNIIGRQSEGDNKFHGRLEYHTKVWNITDYPIPEISYKGELVFRASGKNRYYKSGRWKKSFVSLHSRACNIHNDWVASFSPVAPIYNDEFFPSLPYLPFAFH